MLVQDQEAQRWLEEPISYPNGRQEQERRVAELARDLAARTMSSSSQFIRPSDQEVARAKALILKWLNPQIRAVLLTKHEQPKKRSRRLSVEKKESCSSPLEPRMEQQ